MSYSTPASNGAQARYVLTIKQVSTAFKFSLVKDFGSIENIPEPPPNDYNYYATEAQVDSLFQDFVDMINDSTGFEFLYATKEYSSSQELTATA